MNGRKPGRPTDSPKIYEVKARVDERTMQILEAYARRSGKNRAACIRDAIALLEKEAVLEDTDA